MNGIRLGDWLKMSEDGTDREITLHVWRVNEGRMGRTWNALSTTGELLRVCRLARWNGDDWAYSLVPITGDSYYPREWKRTK